MSDFTILELHIHDGPNLDTDAPGLPFGKKQSKSEPAKPRPQKQRESGSLSDRLPTRLLVGVAVVILAIGAVVAAKLLKGDAVDELADEF
jgi:hypothetical protein